MSLDLLVTEKFRSVVREEIRAALAELKAPAADQFLTYKEAAAFVGCCVSTITKWIQDGVLRSYGRERTVRVLRSEVVAAMVHAATEAPEESDDEFAKRILAKRRK